MQVIFLPGMHADSMRAEAEARGLSTRLQLLADRRQDDDLAAEEALTLAAEELGLAEAFQIALAEAAWPLTQREEDRTEELVVDDAHGGMPMLRLDGATARFVHDPAPAQQLAVSLERLVRCLTEEPTRTTASLDVGLGGSGGCAAGECLPEDAPAGPLFDRRAG